MKSFIIALAFGAIGLGTVPAAAQVNDRQDRQHARIAHGVRSGDLTRREAHRLHRQQGRIAHAERRARYSGGRLTYAERRRLDARQNRADRAIYRQKHERQHYGHRHY